MSTRDIAAEAAGIAIRTTPGAGGTVATALNGEVALSLLVGVLTATFLILQIGYTVWKWRREGRVS